MPIPFKISRSMRWILGGLLLIAAVGCARFLDFPAIPDAKPGPLADCPTSPEAVFHDYLIGGFIDTEHAWRIDAPKADVDLIIKHLALHPSPTVPHEFWRVPPYYWPRSPGKGLVAYRSYGFTDDTRGADGYHFFLLHDTVRSRAYVIFKNNF